MKRITKLQLLVAAVAASQLGATDCGQVLRDPGFDLWCGEELCTWKLVRGDIERVGTWHESDSGVAFLGTDTAIQQISPVNSNDGSCIRFTMVADVALDADVFLNLDLEGDGTVERAERIPTSSWAPIEVLINIEGQYDGIRFELAKSGPGRAVLANIGAELAHGECEGLTPINAGPRPLGARCFTNDECASGICTDSETEPTDSVFQRACAGCDATNGCEAGETCGLGDPVSPLLFVPEVCVPIGAKELAEQCITDEECASGICNAGPGDAGVCSSCRTAGDCIAGASCDFAWVTTALQPGPSICRPGERAGASGDPCGTNDDCASGACAGSERKTCDDGRACNSPADCPVTGGLAPGPCTTVGIQGGTCT